MNSATFYGSVRYLFQIVVDTVLHLLILFPLVTDLSNNWQQIAKG